MNQAIEVKGLKKSYSNNTVLRGISFAVEKGEVFALLGVNGAGKTTALECIEGLREYDSGSIEVKGKVGIQLQSASLPAHIKPMEAVKLFAKWNNVKLSEAVTKSMGIEDIAQKQYFQLSTGQKRRLHLALSLIANPDIVFLDEPTAGLDVDGRISLHGQIRELKAMGKTIILASHDMAEVEALCDRIAIIKGGQIVFCGSVSQLNEKVARHFNIKIKTENGEESYESVDIGDTLLTLLQDLKQRGVSVLDVKVDRGTLEQHFLEMTGRDNK